MLDEPEAALSPAKQPIFFKDAIKDSQERKGTIYYFDSFSYLS